MNNKKDTGDKRSRFGQATIAKFNEVETARLGETMAEIDPVVLRHLFYATQFALNDIDTVERVSKETGISESVLHVLTGISIDLSNSPEVSPELRTMAEVIASADELDDVKTEMS